MIEIQQNIVPKYNIKNFQEYVFGEDEKLYNSKKNVEVILKLKRYTKGYYLRGKFYSEKRVEGMKTEINEIKGYFANYLKQLK